MPEDQQTHDIKTRIGMMIGITKEEKLMAETIVMTTMDIMTTRREVHEMLTTATSMNP